jgi:hypothetical protein
MPPRGGWSDLQIAYMRWLCLPNDKDMGGTGLGLRDPATPTEFALKYGVNLQELYNWQRIQGWDQALEAVSDKVHKSLRPLFMRKLNAALLKPDKPGYDRILTAKVRYVDPIIDEHERSGVWELSLPEASNNRKFYDISQAQQLEKYRALPTEQREILLDVLSELVNNGDEPTNLSPFYSVMKPYADDEPEPAQLPALPAPTDTPGGDTTRDTTDTTPRYDPGRGIRKPIRKPRDTKR